jgi:hypothetical protein
VLRKGVLTQHCVCVSRLPDRDKQRDNQEEGGGREQDAEDSYSTQEWAIERQVGGGQKRQVGGGQELEKADIDRHDERERAEERERVFMQHMSGPANGRCQQVSVYLLSSKLLAQQCKY